MADLVAITAGTGTSIATDERSVQGSTAHVQIVDARNVFTRVQVTPTVSTGAGYAQFDAVGGLLTFAAVNSASAAPVILEAATLFDKSDTKPPITLVLFNQTFTAMADSAVFNPSDADMLNYVGHIVFAAATTDYADFSTNSAAASVNLDLPIIPTGTSVFGQLYLPTATVPTFASTTDVVVSLTFRQQ